MTPNRPLSPHLQVYKPQITSVLSISHRATGVALSAGAVVLVAWLFALASSPTCYAWLADIFATTLGNIALIGWTFCFYYHLCNGIRHLAWDTGRGFDLKNVYRSGYAVLIGAFGFTAATWGFICYG